MSFIRLLFQRCRDGLGALILLGLALWSSSWPVTSASSAIYRLHFTGGICSKYVSTTTSVESAVMCALLTLFKGAPAFSFCPDEVPNCIISTASYELGAWDVSKPLCRLYSNLLPVPYDPPPSNGTKRFVLSSTTVAPGSKANLESNNHCTSQGYEFGVLSTVAEAQLALDQVGYAGTPPCTAGSLCSTWFNIDTSLRWADGTIVNRCEFSFSTQPNQDHCFESSASPSKILAVACSHDEHNSLCQTFD